MVNTFMEGVNPTFKKVVREFLSRVLGKLPERILIVLQENLDEREPGAMDRVRDSLTSSCDAIGKALNAMVSEYAWSTHVAPILDAVAALPKEQLAEMAEALVNLTSFRQKVSGETETVGGPIDLAVISKGDGFIWIKRKHYFKPELNQHFFANYYRNTSAEPPSPED